jgi:hypothetical protein
MIVLAFWGLTRNMKMTSESVERIRAALPAHMAFAHTYASVVPYVNRRANEESASIVPDVERLRADAVEVEDLEAVKRGMCFTQYRSHADPWGTNYETMDNFILAMHSRQKVTSMIMRSGVKVDKVVFMRPDLLYKTLITPEMLDKDGWVIPDFHLYNGFNDRFCIACARSFHVYGNIFTFLKTYSIMYPLHSETVHSFISKSFKIPLYYAPFRFQRIRMDGSVDVRDRNV